MQTKLSDYSTPSHFLSLLLVYAFLGAVTGGLQFLSGEGLRLISGTGWKIAAVSGGAFFLYFQFFSRARSKLSLTPHAFILGIILVLISDLPGRRFVFYIDDSVRPLALVAGLLVCGLCLFLIRREKSSSWYAPLTLVLVQTLLLISFLSYAEGRMIFSDDHPSFLYRFQLLREHFPHIPFYNTEWNAGYNAREFLPSGMLNVALFSFPMIFWWGDINTLEWSGNYTSLIGYLYIIIVPWSMYLAGRVLKLSQSASLISALLAFAPSLTYLKWLLQFGTLGFLFSSAFLPLTLALSIKLSLSEESPGWKDVFFLLVASFCCITWSLQGISLLPVIVFGALRLRHIFAAKRFWKTAVFIVLFAALNGPWMVTFLQASKVFSFLSGDTLPGSNAKSFKQKDQIGDSTASTEQLRETHRKLKEALVQINPLLLLFALPGVFLLRHRSASIVFGATLLWLILIGGTGDLVKPQLELRRMLIPASFLMCILAGVSLNSILKELLSGAGNFRASGFARAALCGVSSVVLLGALAVSPLTARAIYLNQSDEKYTFAPEQLRGLSEAIREHGGKGRVFFPGFILHELGATSWDTQNGGHIAPLATFSGKPLYASDFYHTRWSTVDPMPLSFRDKGWSGYEEFLDLINATSVVTFKREWSRWCRDNPNYTRVYKSGRFLLCTRNNATPSYFLKGSGTVETIHGGLLVHPESTETVIKYRYHPWLRSNHLEEVELFPYPVFVEDIGGGKSREVSFIGIRVSDSYIDSERPVRISFSPDS